MTISLILAWITVLFAITTVLKYVQESVGLSKSIVSFIVFIYRQEF